MGDLDFFNKNTGLGMGMQGLFTGIERGERTTRHWSDMMTANQNRGLAASREQREQEMHPLELDYRRTRNDGQRINNDRTSQQISHKDKEHKMKQFDTFLQTIQDTGDAELAFIKSGLPKQGRLAEIANLPHEQREQLFQAWTKARNRNADYTSKRDHEENLERDRRNREAQRETMREQEAERTRRALLVAHSRAAAGATSARNRKWEEASTHYFEAARIAMEAGDLVKARSYEQAAQEMERKAMEARAVSKNPPAGSLDVGAMTNMPTTQPPPRRPLEVPGLANHSGVTNPANVPTGARPPTVSNW